jgi:hypothetical protein
VNSKFTTIAFLLLLYLTGCQNDKATQIAENTFIYKTKVYKLIDNELTEVAELDTKRIRKFEILKPQTKSLGTIALSYVKSGASARLEALYRGNYLYFKLYIEGLNDLKENYSPGKFTIEFVDEFGFFLHSTEVPTGDLVGMIGGDNKIDHFEFNGKTEMSTEINSSIKTFSVSAAINKNGKSNF